MSRKLSSYQVISGSDAVQALRNISAALEGEQDKNPPQKQYIKEANSGLDSDFWREKKCTTFSKKR